MKSGRSQKSEVRSQKKIKIYFLSSIFCSLSSVFCFLSSVISAQEDAGFSQEERMQKARQYYTAGKELLQQGNYSAADIEFKKAQGLLKNQPALPADNSHPAQSLAEKANLLTQKGQPEEAINLYLRAINSSPQDANLYYNLAIEYLKTKRFKEAAQTFKKVVQLNPKDKDAYYNLGVLYESFLADKRQALDYYRRYLKYASAADNTIEVKEWVLQIKKELKTR